MQTLPRYVGSLQYGSSELHTGLEDCVIPGEPGALVVPRREGMMSMPAWRCSGAAGWRSRRRSPGGHDQSGMLGNRGVAPDPDWSKPKQLLPDRKSSCIALNPAPRNPWCWVQQPNAFLPTQADAYPGGSCRLRSYCLPKHMIARRPPTRTATCSAVIARPVGGTRILTPAWHCRQGI